jgi:hypothetical protein
VQNGKPSQLRADAFMRIGVANSSPCFAQQNQSLRSLEEMKARERAFSAMTTKDAMVHGPPRCDLSFDAGCVDFYRQRCRKIPVPDKKLGTRLYGSQRYGLQILSASRGA